VAASPAFAQAEVARRRKAVLVNEQAGATTSLQSNSEKMSWPEQKPATRSDMEIRIAEIIAY
jgi:hypothetical protein